MENEKQLQEGLRQALVEAGFDQVLTDEVELYADLDSTGDPAFYVQIVFKDGVPESELGYDKLQSLKKWVRDWIRSHALDPDRFPYIRFILESELELARSPVS